MPFYSQEDIVPMMEHAYTTPPDMSANEPGIFSGTAPLRSIGLGLAKVEPFLYENLAKPLFQPLAEYADSILGTDLKGFLDSQEEQFKRENAAVKKYFSPDPNTVGIAGNAINGLFDVGTRFALGTLATGTPIGGALTAGGSESYNTYEEAIAAGVDPKTAKEMGLISGVVVGAGSLIPQAFGGSVLKNFFLTGPAVNVALGTASRGTTKAVLDANGYHDMANQYQWADGKALAADYVIGAFFGGWGAFSHALRARAATERVAGHTGEAAKLDELAHSYESGNIPDPSQEHLDAALVAKDHANIELDSAPGIPADVATRNMHVEAVHEAIDALANDKDVSPDLTDANFLEKPGPEAARINNIVEGALRDAGFPDVLKEIRDLQRRAKEEKIPLADELASPGHDIQKPSEEDAVSTKAAKVDEPSLVDKALSVIGLQRKEEPTPIVESPALKEVLAEKPSMKIANEDGSTSKAADAVAEADKVVSDTNKFSKAFQVAVDCFTRGGA